MRGIGIVGVAVAVLALAACGGGRKLLSPVQAKQAVAAAAAKTRASTVHVELSVSLKQVNGQGAAVYGVSGDLGPKLGRLLLDQRSIHGDLRHVVISRRGGHLVVYSNPSRVPLPKGKSWLEIDLTRYGRLRYGADTTFLAGADQDPFAAIQLATAPAAHMTDLGLEYLPDDTVNTHYRARVNVVSVAKERGVTGRGLRTLSADMTGGAAAETVDVWVSKLGNVARIEVQKTLRDAATGASLRQTSIADFTRFGEAVHVTLPPPSSVADYFTLAHP